jgi:hypothetical protein
MPTAGMGEAWADGCKSGSFTLSGKPQSLGDEVRTVTGEPVISANDPPRNSTVALPHRQDTKAT